MRRLRIISFGFLPLQVGTRVSHSKWSLITTFRWRLSGKHFGVFLLRLRWRHLFGFLSCIVYHYGICYVGFDWSHLIKTFALYVVIWRNLLLTSSFNIVLWTSFGIRLQVSRKWLSFVPVTSFSYLTCGSAQISRLKESRFGVWHVLLSHGLFSSWGIV